MATDNNNITLTMGGDRTNALPLFLQNKTGIPHVTNWDDTITSISKTDKSYFVDQQGVTCGKPSDISILDDICAVGYKDHKSILKTVKDLGTVEANETYVREPAPIVCYNDDILIGSQPDTWYDVFGIYLDYNLTTPEIDESSVDTDSEDYHTYFYDVYLKIEYNGVTTYHPFGGFINSQDYWITFNQDLRSECEDNADWLNGYSNKWYYIKETGKIAVSKQFIVLDESNKGDLVDIDYTEITGSGTQPGYIYILSQYFTNTPQNDNCEPCGEVELCASCAAHSALEAFEFNVEASLIKISEFESGKVDIYHKKSGKIESYTDNQITSTDHDLQDYDIIKIGGEFGTGNLVSDLNGVFYVKRISDNVFAIYTEPTCLDDNAVRITNVDDFTGMSWTCVGNSEKSSDQSWFYYGSYASNFGLNGYYNFNLPSTNHGGNISYTTIEDEVNVPTDNMIPLYKSAQDYLQGCDFGKSLDLVKVKHSGEEFYVLAVSEPGNGFTIEKVGEDTRREFVLPNYAPTGRVSFFKITKDSNDQINSVTTFGKSRAGDQPWLNIEALIPHNAARLTNPADIIESIDAADAAVDETYWLGVNEIPTTFGAGRPFLWTDKFGHCIAVDNPNREQESTQTTDIALYLSSLSINPLLEDKEGYCNIHKCMIDTDITTEMVYQLYEEVSDKSGEYRGMGGCSYHDNRLCFGHRDGISVYDFSGGTVSTVGQYTLVNKVGKPSDAGITFADYICHYEDYVLTNARCSINEFGNESVFDNGDYPDYIHIYKLVRSKFKFLNKVAACFHEDDDFYSDLTESDLDNLGVENIGNLSYGGKTEKTRTWNISLEGKYDIYKDRIVIRDPLEYVVLKDNWEDDEIQVISGQTPLENYFYFRERFNSDGEEVILTPCFVDPCPTYTRYVNYNYDSNFDGSVTVLESYYRHDTLVLFFSIPRFPGYVNVYENLNLKLVIERNDVQDDAPMIKFYDFDPRDTISSVTQLNTDASTPVYDGACDGGTAYDLGTYSGVNFQVQDDGSFVVDVDIPPSVFLDGLIEGDVTNAVDRTQDSYTSVGNVSKTLAVGIKIRRRQTGGIKCYYVDQARLSSGNFYTSGAELKDVSLKLSYSLYEEHKLRRFDLASRKIAITDITEITPSSELVSTVISQTPEYESQIRIGNSNSISYIDERDEEIVKGMLTDSLQIFDSVYKKSDDLLYTDSEYTIKEGQSSTTFFNKTTNTSFDIHSPEFLKLYIRSNYTSTGNMPLSMIGHTPTFNSFDSYISGIATKNSGLNLFLGPLTKANNVPLSIPNIYDTDNGSMPLFGPYLKGYEVPPTGINVTIKGPDSSGGVTLYQKAPIPDTGSMPLITKGPIQDTGDLPLNMLGHKSFNTPLERPPLYMAGMLPSTGGITMHIGRDRDTGNMPLVVKGPITDSANTPLFIFTPYVDDLQLSMPNTKGGSNQGATLVLFDDREVESLNLSVAGPIENNEGVNLFTKYDPINVNNIDDNPHNPCEINGLNYEFDLSSNAEDLVGTHNSIADRNELSLFGFNDWSSYLGNAIKNSTSDSRIVEYYYTQDKINAIYDGNSSKFVVGDNAKVIAPQNTGKLYIYDVSSGVLSNKTTFSFLSEVNSNITVSGARTTIKDIKVSTAGRIAVSFFVNYTDNSDFARKSREYVVIFNGTTKEKSISGPVFSGTTNFADIDSRIGDSLCWDGENLYYSESTTIFERIKRLNNSDSYATPELVAAFSDTADHANYNTNLLYTNSSIKTGFGAKIKVTSDKMVVSAPLLDPYIAQNVLSSYAPFSPRGAVYLFNRSGDTFTYDSAVYAGGLTSSNITPSSFSVTTSSFDVRYFGYDFDYSATSQKLIVGEPGNGGTNSIGGAGKAYVFEAGNVPTLIRTGTTTGDNSAYGLSVALCDHYTEIIFSREGKIYILNTGDSFEFDSELTDDEISQYVPGYATLSSSSESSKIAKLINLGSDKVIFGRKFTFTYGFVTDVVYKLSSISIGKPSNFNLFIKTVEGVNHSIPVTLKSDIASGVMSLTLPYISKTSNMNLVVRVPEPDSGNFPLVMVNTDSGQIPMYIDGLFSTGTGSQNVFLKAPEPFNNSVPLNFVSPFDPNYALNLSIRSASPPQQWSSASMFIDEGTITRTAVEYIGSTSLITLGDSGVKQIQGGISLGIEGGNTGYVNARPTLFMQGQASVEVDEYMSMFIEVDDPSGSDNNSLNMTINNNQTTGTITNNNNDMPLYIINSVPTTSNAPLYLHRRGPGGGIEFKDDLNTFISGPDKDANITLAMNSAYSGENNINLAIPNTLGASSGNRPLMIRGYEE